MDTNCRCWIQNNSSSLLKIFICPFGRLIIRPVIIGRLVLEWLNMVN